MKVLLAALAVVVSLTACQEKITMTGENAVAQANAQRHATIAKTRASTYLVYPDVNDTKVFTDPTFLEAARARPATGTSFAVDDKGTVLTAAHVVTHSGYCTAPDASDAEARKAGTQPTYCTLITQTYSRVDRAKLVYLDEKLDVAVLRIVDLHDHQPYLEIAPWGSFDDGAEVLTVGSPIGNPNFTTVGFISNLDFVRDENSPKQIQFLATVLPGNSGGPLVDIASGRVVGLVVSIIGSDVPTLNGGAMTLSTGMSYATRADQLREIIEKAKSLH